jgi:arylsulfatase
MLGSRAIYEDGWKAVTFKPVGHLYDDGLDPDAPFEDDVWELYHVAVDPSETDDLAAAEPQRLAALVERWWEEARRFQVLPLDNRPLAALESPRPSAAWARRDRSVLHPGAAIVPETVAPDLRNRPHRVVAEVDVTADLGEGVLLAMGTVLGGWSLQVHDRRLRYVHNLLGAERHVVASDRLDLAPGRHELGLVLECAGDFRGIAQLTVDGAVVASGEIPQLTPVRWSITGGGLTCGWEQGPPVGDDYEAPFEFTGRLRRVVVDASGPVHRDLEAELAAIMSEQ